MKGKKTQGVLLSYLRWPLLPGILLIILNAHLYFVNVKAGIITSIYIAVYCAVSFCIYRFKKAALKQNLVHYAIHFNDAVHSAFANWDTPMAVLGLDTRCLWENKLFHKHFSKGLKKRYLISEAIPAITDEALPQTNTENGEMHFHVEDTFYKAVIQRITPNGRVKKGGGQAAPGQILYIVCIYDETEIVHYIRENYDQRLDVGLLYIDNYEESLAKMDDARRSLLTALIDRKINRYMLNIDAITRKLEKDKYIFLFQHKYLAQLQTNKFSLLDDIRTIDSGNDVSITISMGIGIQADTFRKRQEYCRSAMDLALARGGDQVVVKTKENILYYGGKSMQQEKNTRVKARVKAHALRDSIIAAEKVLIMGHSLPDIDAVGSAVGIHRIAQSLGKPARIVVGQATSSLSPLLDMFQNNKNYPENIFTDGETAREFIGDGKGVLLVVVDVNRPSYTDAPDLLPLVASIVVIDHHRQTGEAFENPALSYIEPFASSSCEMVAEILQYAGEEIRPSALEADALYAGIMVDTNNFMNKPGVRTFEALAFLKSAGADVMRIRKMFRSDISEYKVKAEAFQNTEIFMDSFAIACCNTDTCPSPTVAAAKIANELLDINHIRASFALTGFNGKIYISARAIDELNVQLVMERLGGGGHITSAGAQLENCTITEAADRLKSILVKMEEEGDI